jgi:hypothetical protein
MSSIRDWGFIPQFEGLQGPNMRWFSMYKGLEDKQWSDWYIVQMHPKAFYTALILGIEIFVMYRTGFPFDPQDSSNSHLMEEFEQQIVNYGEGSRVPTFMMKTGDVFPLARYYALASRRNYRGSHDYGVLDSGWGWGEFTTPQFGEVRTFWVAQPCFLREEREDILRRDFTELKAPDTGSVHTGKIDLDRDLEWI